MVRIRQLRLQLAHRHANHKRQTTGDVREYGEEEQTLLGICFGRRGDMPRSIAYSRRAIEADTTMVEAYVNLYAGYSSEGRLVEADSVLTEAARRFPDDTIIQSLFRD